MKTSLRFYVDLLGFEIVYKRIDPTFYFIAREGCQIMLEEFDTTKDPWITAKLERPFGRGINFQIETEDVKSLYLKLQKHSFVFFKELSEDKYKTKESFVSLRQFLVKDPDGYLLRFAQNLN